MTSDTSAQGKPKPRGRPRDEERTEAIVDATYRMMRSKGWDDLTINDIARAAGCGTATIYRRWASKEELVATAMTTRPLPPISLTGDPRVDLRMLIAHFGEGMSEMGESIMGFMAATRADPVLREAFEESVVAVVRPRFATLLSEILGPASPHVDVLADAIVSTLILRVGLFGGLGSPTSFADEIMSLVESLEESPHYSA